MKLKLKLPSGYLLILLITLIGFLLRIWSIDKNPPALNWDEVSHGYNAYSILKTGKDEWGVSFPLIFRAFGDYKLPVYIYLTTIPIALFGLNIFSVRLVSVVAGTLAIPGLYLLVKSLFPKQNSTRLPEIAAILLAVSPWHFFISRPALEANLALTLFIFGVWAIHKGLSSSKYFIYGSILLGLTLHTYNTYRVLTPLFLVVFLLLHFNLLKLAFKEKRQTLIYSSLVFLVSFALVANQVFSGTGTARYQKLAILSDQAVYQIGQDRTQSKYPPLVAKLLHNRPLYFLKSAGKNYLDYFSIQFVYQNSGAQRQFAIPGKNLFSLPILLLSFIGTVFVIRKLLLGRFKDKDILLVISLIFLSPIAAAITASPPQALRPTPFIIPVTILAAFGFTYLNNLFKSKNWPEYAISLALLVSIFLGFSRYLSAYWQDYRFEHSSAWQHGYKEAMEYVGEHQAEYERVFVTKYHAEPHIFYAFFNKLDPRELQPNENNIRFGQSDWFWTDKIGSVYFVNDWQIPSWVEAKSLTLESGSTLSTNGALLVTSVEHLPMNTEILKLVEDLSGNIAFVIARFK